MMNQLFKFALIFISCVLFLNLNLVQADSIYECKGVIQNRPCEKGKPGRELKELPKISRYSVKSALPIADTDEVRASPRRDAISVPGSEVKVGEDEVRAIVQDPPKSAVRGQNPEDLLSRSERLRKEFTSGRISLPEAEAESIRLRVLLDTLCTKQSSTYDPRLDNTCRKSADNIQAASADIRDARVKTQG